MKIDLTRQPMTQEKLAQLRLLANKEQMRKQSIMKMVVIAGVAALAALP